MARPKKGAPAKKGLTNDEAAAALAVTSAFIAKRVRYGTLRTLPDGSIDPEQVAEEAARKQARKTGDKDRVDWDTALKRENAKKAKLSRLELQGQLVRRETYERELAELGTLVRDRLRNMGKRLRDRLAAESSARVCGEIVDREVDQALDVLSEMA